MAKTAVLPPFQLVQNADQWQQALAQMPGAHALQSWTWGAIKSRWGWQMLPFVWPSQDGGIPTAVAMVLKRKVPRLPYSVLYVPKGPLLNYEDVATRQQTWRWLQALAQKERAIFIKIDPEVVHYWGVEQERPSPTGTAVVAELQASGWQFADDQIQFRNTVEIDLTRSEEAILAAMKSKTRYNINLAMRKEVTVRVGSPADFPQLATMYQETSARDGFGIRPSAYYLDIWQQFYQTGSGHLLIAEYAQEPIAAVYLVKSGAKAIYMYGASTEKERNRMPNYLLQWEAIRWAKSQNLKTYDLWGAPDAFNEADRLWGVWRFKAGFNGEVVWHMGAWDYVARPFWYWLYSTAVPQYLNRLRAKNRDQSTKER